MVLPLNAVELIFPEDNTTLNYTYILFQWNQESDAVRYNLQALDQNNDTILDIESTITSYIDKINFSWNSSYSWRVKPIYHNGFRGNWSRKSSFTTIDSLTNLNLNVEINNNSQINQELIMFSQSAPDFRTIVIDKFGNQICILESSYINHWDNFGQIYGMLGQGRGGKVNFYNQILWINPEGVILDSHEIKQIANGNIMAFTPIDKVGPIPIGDWTQQFQNLGYFADGIINEFPWKGIKIIEWDWETGEEVWAWNPFDYFSLDDYDIYYRVWWWAITSGKFDWMHSNAFHFDEKNNNIYVSHRHLSRISKISYPSGDVIWNMGLPSEHNTGSENICDDLLFSFQHHIQLIDDGDLLFFDNGNLSDILLEDASPTSRIRRVRVIDDTYCETIWQYDLPENLYGSLTGSVQLLKNGNYFIYTPATKSTGSECTIFEITPEKNIVWKVSSDDPSSLWYRSYKIPSIHPNAVSIIFDQYHKIQIEGKSFNRILLNNENPKLSFTIYNPSGYDQPFIFSFNDNNGWFKEVKDTIFIASGDESSHFFYPQRIDGSSTSIQFSISPLYHSWDSINLEHEVSISPQSNFINLKNYPNPFKNTSIIRYKLVFDELIEDMFVKIDIYDLQGRNVKTLINKKQNAGYQSVKWNATNNKGQPVSAGVYLYSIEVGDFRHTEKMILLK